jgi:hypothetical protein
MFRGRYLAGGKELDELDGGSQGGGFELDGTDGGDFCRRLNVDERCGVATTWK